MKRKLLITLGGLSSIIAPIAAISCSCSSKALETTDTTKTNEITSPMPPVEETPKYKADKAAYTYDYKDSLATFTLSEKDSRKIEEIINSHTDDSQGDIWRILVSGCAGNLLPNIASWIYEPLKLATSDVANELIPPYYVDVRYNNENLFDIYISFETRGTKQPTEQQSYEHVREYIWNVSSFRKIDKDIAEDIRDGVKEIFNIIIDAIKA